MSLKTERRIVALVTLVVAAAFAAYILWNTGLTQGGFWMAGIASALVASILFGGWEKAMGRAGGMEGR